MSVLTVLVGAFTIHLVSDAIYNAVDAQLNMQQIQLEKLHGN